MASPQVAGAAALILSVEPSLSATALKADILNNVDKPPSLCGPRDHRRTPGRVQGAAGLRKPAAASPSDRNVRQDDSGREHGHGIFANYKVVNTATLSVPALVTKLSVYAVPGIDSPSPQAVKAVIYSDSGGSPGALLATGTEVTYRGNLNGSGWFELPFASPVALSPGTYWLGFITGATTEGLGYVYDSVTNSRAYNANTYASGPTNPFGSPTKDSEQASVYATYTTSAPPPTVPPVNTAPPTISGTAQTGQTLSASTGSWSESPTAYAYQWRALRLDRGELCSHLRRHRAHLLGGLGGRRLHAARLGNRLELRRTLDSLKLNPRRRW